MLRINNVFICLIASSFVIQRVSSVSWNEHFMDADDSKTCCNTAIGSVERRQPQIYCYAGREKKLIHIFETVLMEISIPPDSYTLYEGNSPNDVMAEFESKHSLWNINILTSKQREVKLNPFNQTCIGILTDRNYKVHLNVIRLDFWRILMFVAGVLLFYLGPEMSKNVLFYYVCGVSLGVFASFLILVYFFSRLLPRKPIMYGFIVGGWAVSLYMIRMLWDNLQAITGMYKNYVIGYFITTSFISFIVCYRFGPVTDPRSKNIIKWILQAAGLSLIFASSQFQEAVLAADIIILFLHSFPKSWLFPVKNVIVKVWRRPPKRKLLSEDEYYEEGVRETSKALNELRKFCSSPECNQWRAVTKLKDPVRFAKFVEGSSHLSDNEVLAFETETHKHVLHSQDNFTDDDSDDD